MANWLNKYEQGGMVLKKKTKDNYGKRENPNDIKASVGPDFVGLGYNTKGRDYSPAWGGQFQWGGFLQPNDVRLPSAIAPPNREDILSSELARSIGGEDGEPAYLVPSFKGGRRVDEKKEFNKTGEHLGGPFKTWQEAEKFGEMRHEYVEKGQSLPSPLKWWGDMQMGGGLPGTTGMMYARTINPAPSNGKYAKKTKASAQNGTDIKLGNNPVSSFIENLLIDKNDKTEIQKQQDFVDNWYKNRKVFKDNGAVDTIKYPKISSDTKPIYTVKTDLGAYGKYDPTANEIKLNRLEDFAELGVPTHEYNHFYQSNPNIGFFPKKNKNRKIGDKYVLDPWEKGLRNNIDNITPEDMKYYLSPDEVQSRLMEIRYLNNLKPDQKVKPSDINNLKIPKESEYLKEKLKSKDHGLDWFLNNIVKNDQQQESTQAQNGKEMSFYQQGLDFTPKTISKNGSVIKDDMGQWAHPGEVTEISGNTMATHGYGDVPLYVVPDKGSPRIVQANTGTQKFPGATKFTEFPMAQNGDWLSKYATEPVRQDATRNVIPRKMTDKEKLEAAAQSDQAQKRALNTAKEVIAERTKNKQTKGDINTPGSWHLEDKARLFPSSVGGAGEMFDEYINPATYVGVLADALGESVIARDPKGIATSLGLSAIGGGLGFDPIGGGIKAVKSIGKGIVKPSFTSGQEAYDFINNMVSNGQEDQMLKILTEKTGKTSSQLENEFGRAIGNDGTIRDPEYIIRHANMLSGKNNLPKLPKSLKELDETAGKLVSPTYSGKFDNSKILARTNEILKKGVGIKKKDIPIELKPSKSSAGEFELWVNENDPKYPTGQSKSGTIDFNPNFRGVDKSLTFTDWLKGKTPTTKYNTYDPDAIPAVIKTGDFPYQNRMDLEGTGIGAEAAEAFKQALNEEGLQLHSSKSHTEAGKLRYLTEFLNNRKQVVDYNDNPDWMIQAEALRDLLGGAPISKKEAKAYMNEYPVLKPAHVRFQYDNGGWLNKYK